MITLKTENGLEETLDIEDADWHVLSCEEKRKIMIEFLVSNYSVYAYNSEEFTGDCL